MTKEYKNPETIGLHAGWRKDETTNSVAVPIHQTSSYQFDNTDHAANLFSLSELGNIYSRIMNPTNAVLEERIATLEGGVGALGVASGQAASSYSIQNIAKAGDNIVASAHLYGGTYNQFKNPFKDMGIEVRFVDPENPQNFKDATDENTRAYYGEVLPNPSFKVFPIEEVAELGKPLGIPLIVDNTAAPIICKPFDHGATALIHSTTKYIGGHGTSIGGIIVDGGNFDWIKDRKRQPLLNEPDQSYHGAVWADAVPQLTGANIPFVIRARVVLLRDLGAPLSPFNAFQIIQGLETVALRMKQHCSNAEKVVNFLDGHKKVKKVIYPTNYQGEIRDRAKKYMQGGYGSLIGMDLGTKEAGAKFIDNLKMLYHVANIGDARSLAIHPATTTHSQLTEKEMLAAGVTPGYVRLSIGIEHPDDIVADIKQALAA